MSMKAEVKIYRSKILLFKWERRRLDQSRSDYVYEGGSQNPLVEDPTLQVEEEKTGSK